MRILLNLLPIEKKYLLSRRFYLRFFLWQTTFLFVLMFFYTGVLGGMYFLAHYQKQTSETNLSSFDQYNQEAKKLTQYQDIFKRTNVQIKDVGRYTNDHFQWNNLFRLLGKTAPADVTFVELSTKDYTISLVGEAATREAFLKFQDALTASPCTSDVKVPISNLFAQTQVEFQLDFNIKRECLLNQE